MDTEGRGVTGLSARAALAPDRNGVGHLCKAPFGKHFLTQKHKLLQGMRGENDLTVSSGWGEENVFTPKFKAWGLLCKIAFVHVHGLISRCPKYAEQLGNRHCLFIKRNPVTPPSVEYTNIVSGAAA